MAHKQKADLADRSPGEEEGDLDLALDQWETRFWNFESTRALELLKGIPAWLPFSPEERERLAPFFERALSKAPVNATPIELLWCVAFEAVARRPRGRETRWATGFEGFFLVEAIEVTLRSMGLKANEKKGLLQAIHEVREAAPRRYGKYTEERLRKAYYEALPTYRAIREGRIFAPNAGFQMSKHSDVQALVRIKSE